MKPELTLLVWSVALTLLQVVIAAGFATLQVGLPKLAGNREGTRNQGRNITRVPPYIIKNKRANFFSFTHAEHSCLRRL